MHIRDRSLVINLGACALVFQTACSDKVETSYQSLSEAKRDGAIERGWLPSILPSRSSNIREVHNLDTNEVWCSFEFPQSEADDFRKSLAVVDAPGHSITVRSPAVAWWPAFLVGPLSGGALKQHGFKLYGNAKILFAVDWTLGKAYFHAQRR